MLLLLGACAAPGAQLEPLVLTPVGVAPTTVTKGEAYAGFSVEASGGLAPYSYSLQGTWPTGITIDDSGLVSGTPTVDGTFTDLAVQVQDSNSATATYELEAPLEVLAALPVVSVEALSNWWSTTPTVNLSDFGSIRLHFTLKNNTTETLEFVGDTGGSDPVDELQLWFSPDASVDPVVSMAAFPKGSYPVGSEMTWDLTVELGAAAGPNTNISFRADVSPIGTGGPDRLELTFQEVSVIR